MASFMIDGQPVQFSPGQSVLQAAMAAAIYIPHLCFHPQFSAHGSCRVCMVKINGRTQSACTTPAAEGLQVENISAEIQQLRREILQMFFVEGNHVCPSCEKSGACHLQSVAEFCQLLMADLPFQHPKRRLDASHADWVLDFTRCIHCELCVKASRDVDQKSVFALSGRGFETRLVINAEDGLLGNSEFASTDKAASVCPVGVFLRKHQGFDTPIGRRKYDLRPIDKITEE